jgi:signal transduction histidine kinase/ActR/RegA family two-component response regulator
MRSLLIPRGGSVRGSSWRAHGWRYFIAVASVALTAALALLGHQVLEADILLLSIAAVTVSAWYGGVGPGLLATMLTILATDYLLPAARTDAVPTLFDRLRPSLFASVALLISALSEAKRLAESDLERSLATLEQQVEERTRALSEANHALQAQIEERERLEGELRHAQKLEAIAHLAGGVAHDFNNILMVIQGYSDMLLAEVQPGNAIRNDVREIQQAARRGGDLTKQLLAFGRKQVLHVRPLDLNAVLVDTSHMLARLIGESITLELHPAMVACPIEADRVQLEQVLINLAVNARDAMARRGTLSIAVDRVQRERDTPDLAHGVYAQLMVRDTGCGMDAATRERIFEPFFTTKAPGVGSGLGLSTVYGVVKQLHGHIVVDSQPLGGTTFTIYFPVTAKPIAAAREALAAELMSARAETVLVVEDDRAVRAVVDHLLRRHGYEVLLAAGPREALAAARAHGGRIDLVLSDVIMPGMSGPEMVTLLAAQFPETRAVYLSGYPTEVLVRERVLDAQARVVQKPVSARELLQAVRDALGPHEPVPIRIAS